MNDRLRIALVTGGSRGIGRAVVEALLAAGWTVELTGLHREGLEAAVAELAQRSSEHVFGTVVDVRRQEQVDDWVRRVIARHGCIDLLVNNAGLGRFGAVDELSGEIFREVVETNLLGAFYAMRAVAAQMRLQGSGSIVNIASLAAKNPFAGGAAYNASKFGLLGLSEAAMLDLRHAGVRVAAILPGSVDTDFHRDRRPQRDWMLAPEDVAAAVLDLVRYPDRAIASLLELRPSRPAR